MQPGRIVWADLRFNHCMPSSSEQVSDMWQVDRVDIPERILQVTGRILPALLVFEFDRPDLSSLSSLSSVRQQYAAIPLLMLTEYHSEALAVWALRNRVSDYLVVPVAQDELMGSVKEIVTARQSVTPIPNELRFHRTVRCKTEAAVLYVENHYYQPIREEVLADICGMSVSSFSRTFKKEQGKTFREYLVSYRVGKACELLLTRGVKVTDVAYTVGFNDTSYFSRMFRQVVGNTPVKFLQDGKGRIDVPSERKQKIDKDMHKTSSDQK